MDVFVVVLLFIIIIILLVIYFKQTGKRHGPNHIVGIVANIEASPPSMFTFTYNNGVLESNDLQPLDPSRDYTFLYRDGVLRFVA